MQSKGKRLLQTLTVTACVGAPWNISYAMEEMDAGQAPIPQAADLVEQSDNSLKARWLLELGDAVKDSTKAILEKMAIMSAQANPDAVSALPIMGTLITGYGASVPANTISNVAASNLSGFVIGTVTDASAARAAPHSGNLSQVGMIRGRFSETVIEPKLYNLSVKIGEQTYTATTSPASAAAINFQGVVNSANKFSISYAEDVAGITNESDFTAALKAYFRLDTSIDTWIDAYKFSSVVGSAVTADSDSVPANTVSNAAPDMSFQVGEESTDSVTVDIQSAEAGK